MLGLIIGAASGAVQVWMLARFSKAVSGGALDKLTVLFGVCQFFLPLVVLLGCAFLLTSALLWAAVGMVAMLIGFSLIRFLTPNKNGNGR